MIDAKVLTIGFDAISKKMSENRMQPDLSIFGCRSLQLVALCLQFLHPLTVLFDP